MRSDKLAAACIRLVVEDMYLGLSQATPDCSLSAIREAASIYHDEKWGLLCAGSAPVPVPDSTYFLLKKCVFHWTMGIRLYLCCQGMPEQEAHQQAVTVCSGFLRDIASHETPNFQQAEALYRTRISSRIRQQYALAGAIPTDEWCAWLELEAVKLAVDCKKEGMV